MALGAGVALGGGLLAALPGLAERLAAWRHARALEAERLHQERLKTAILEEKLRNETLAQELGGRRSPTGTKEGEG